MSHTDLMHWLTTDQERLRNMPRPDMLDDAYHDYLQMLAREKDMPADRREWWLDQAVQLADTFPHKLFKHCPTQADRLTLAKYFPEAWAELQAEGAKIQAEFEYKDSYLTEWKQHTEMLHEKEREEAAEQRQRQREAKQDILV